MRDALLLLSCAVLILVGGFVARALALRRPERPVEPRWFGFAQATQALTMAAVFLWIVGLTTPAVRAAVVEVSLLAGPLAPMAGGAAFVLPLLVVACTLAILLHDVARRLGTTDLPWSNALRQVMWFNVMLLGPALAGGMIVAHVTRGDVRGALPWLIPVALALALGGRGWRRAAGFVPQALTHGELREAVFGLAARAKVALRQLYVVPMRRSRMANAFAVQDRTVILTDYLLARLDRAEVDAILAHEVAHLELRHPRKLGWVRAFSLAIPIGLAVYGLPVPWTLPALLAGMLASTAFSRRCEFAADAGALALGARPESLISGLARITRLNHLPGRWARGLTPFLTHPGLDARAGAIARRAAVPPERVAAALAPPPDPDSPYVLPAALEAGVKVFDSSFKAGRAAAFSWTLLAAGSLAPVALFAAGSLLGAPPLPHLVWLMLGTLAAFGALWLVTDRLAPRTLGGLRERLARHLDVPAASGAWYVGLSPEAHARAYEGYSNWDFGVLSLAPGRLLYAGGECRFALTPAEIVDLRVTRGFPSWVPTAVVQLRWRASSGPEGALRLGVADVAWLHQSVPAARRLLEALERWRAQGDAAEPATAEPATTLPPHAPVTGAAPGAAVNAGYVLNLAIVLGILTALGCVVFGLPFASWREAGWTDAHGAALVATLVWTAPLLRHRDEPAAERAQETVRRAA